MENRKRPFEAVSTSNDGFSTPEKRVSVVCRLQDSSKWGVDETCQYLRNEGLGQWQEAFRGQSSVAESWYAFIFNTICEISDFCHPAHKIDGVQLRSLTDADLEKMGIE